jgi:hypothetical protein
MTDNHTHRGDDVHPVEAAMDIDDILMKLDDDQVLKITREGCEVHFDEQCDGWFRCTLSLSEARALGEWLAEVSNDPAAPTEGE